MALLKPNALFSSDPTASYGSILVFGGLGLQYYTRLRHFSVGVEIVGSYLVKPQDLRLRHHPEPALRLLARAAVAVDSGQGPGRPGQGRRGEGPAGRGGGGRGDRGGPGGRGGRGDRRRDGPGGGAGGRVVPELSVLEKALAKGDFAAELQPLDSVVKVLRQARARSLQDLDMDTRGRLITTLSRVARQTKPAPDPEATAPIEASAAPTAAPGEAEQGAEIAVAPDAAADVPGATEEAPPVEASAESAETPVEAGHRLGGGARVPRRPRRARAPRLLRSPRPSPRPGRTARCCSAWAWPGRRSGEAEAGGDCLRRGRPAALGRGDEERREHGRRPAGSNARCPCATGWTRAPGTTRAWGAARAARPPRAGPASRAHCCGIRCAARRWRFPPSSPGTGRPRPSSSSRADAPATPRACTTSTVGSPTRRVCSRPEATCARRSERRWRPRTWTIGRRLATQLPPGEAQTHPGKGRGLGAPDGAAREVRPLRRGGEALRARPPVRPGRPRLGARRES